MINIRKLAHTAIRANCAQGCSLAVPLPSFGIPSVLASFVQKSNFSNLLSRAPATRPILARPPPILNTQVAGLKVRYALKKRCKDCYIVVRNERTYIMCPTHPRHKQMQPVKKARYTWILTAASQSKDRGW